MNHACSGCLCEELWLLPRAANTVQTNVIELAKTLPASYKHPDAVPMRRWGGPACPGCFFSSVRPLVVVI